MAAGIPTVRQSYIDLRGINLGMQFLRQHSLQPGQKYSMVIEGITDTDIQGTLDKSGFIGGLSRLYREFELTDGDEIEVVFDDGIVRLTPPQEKRRTFGSTTPDAKDTERVFGRLKLKHVHIETYAPGNLRRWIPQTEPDVYMVFGALSENTDYRYCCGTSQALLDRLGWNANTTKPDAILIDRATDEYLIAEFKMNSKDFKLNHQREDVDVLLCWLDDEPDTPKLPARVLELKSLLEKVLTEGTVDL